MANKTVLDVVVNGGCVEIRTERDYHNFLQLAHAHGYVWGGSMASLFPLPRLYIQTDIYINNLKKGDIIFRLDKCSKTVFFESYAPRSTCVRFHTSEHAFNY